MSSHTSTSSTSDSPEISAPRRGRRPTPIDPERLEDLASRLPTQAAVAAEFGVTQSTLAARLLGSAELRRAWERGRSKYEEARPKRGIRARASARLMPPMPPPAPREDAPAAREAVPAPAPPPCAEGSPSERVLAAIGLGRRTFGELRGATGLGYDAVVLAVQRLACRKLVVARGDGGVRRHYLAGEEADNG